MSAESAVYKNMSRVAQPSVEPTRWRVSRLGVPDRGAPLEPAANWSDGRSEHRGQHLTVRESRIEGRPTAVNRAHQCGSPCGSPGGASELPGSALSKVCIS